MLTLRLVMCQLPTVTQGARVWSRRTFSLGSLILDPLRALMRHSRTLLSSFDHVTFVIVSDQTKIITLVLRLMRQELLEPAWRFRHLLCHHFAALVHLFKFQLSSKARSRAAQIWSKTHLSGVGIWDCFIVAGHDALEIIAAPCRERKWV